jgi:MFS family permease
MIQILVIALISIVSGITTSGINLAITNIGLKMAPREGAIAYISARNVVVAVAAALGPLLGGLMADRLNLQHIGRFHFENWNILFLAGGALAILALQTIKGIREEGEIKRPIAIREMHVDFMKGLRERFSRETISALLFIPVTFPVRVSCSVREHLARRNNRTS